MPKQRISSLSRGAGGTLLVVHGPTEPEASERSKLSLIDVRREHSITTLFEAPDGDALDAVWVGERTRPPGRSSVVAGPGAVAQLYCLNAYARGRQVRSRTDRTIDRIRVLTRSVAQRNGSGLRRLGEGAVEADGSFFVELPAQTPLQLATLGRDGGIIEQMQSFFWVMPGERRGCIGCHEDRELTPVNRHVLALRRGPDRIGLDSPPRPDPGDAGGKSP